MKDRTLWNRRHFMQVMGCSSLGVASAGLSWLPGAGETKYQATPLFAYVGYSGRAQGDAAGHPEQGIQVFAVEGERWTPTQAIASERASFLTLHPNQRFLYAINEVDTYQNLPSGVIEAYAIDRHYGSLTLLNRQPLSLSGTLPRHMAVSPDGRNLVVAVHGGGAYNVLPVGEDGRLGRVSGIVKETGSGPDRDSQDAAHPQMVLFDTTGQRLLGADLGSDRLSVFTLDQDQLTVCGRNAVQPGSGPRHMALHPSGHLLFVANALDASVSCYGYDATNGRVLPRLQHVSTLPNSFSGQKSAVEMAMHPSGQFLYTSNRRSRPDRSLADGIAAWRIDAATGALTPVQSRSEGLRQLNAMTVLSDGTSLVALSQKRDSVLRLRINPDSGRLSQLVEVARVSAPMSLAVKYL